MDILELSIGPGGSERRKQSVFVCGSNLHYCSATLQIKRWLIVLESQWCTSVKEVIAPLFTTEKKYIQGKRSQKGEEESGRCELL